MKIGIPKEIKDQEGHVAQTPAGVRRLAKLHSELVERLTAA